MNPTRQPRQSPDFRTRSALGISLTALVLILPFSVNSFVQDRYLIGVLSAAIVCILIVIAWLSHCGRYNPAITLATFVPGVIAILYIGFPVQEIITGLWCYPAILFFYVMLSERQAWLANIALLVAIFPRAWSILELPVATRFTATLLGVSIVSAIFVRVITLQQRKLETLAVTDPLTGLSNRLMLRSALEHAIEQSRRTHAPMTLLALDLDRFKAINDTLGHDAGDSVLRGVGELLSKRIRRADHVFRLGGEEFIALLYGTNAENGRQVAEELRNAVEMSPLLHDRTVTVSIGVATLLPGENWMEWMKRGDENLYRAKSEGRNRVAT